MGFQLSPGVVWDEIDLTTVIPAVGTTIGALAGVFRWGPANVPTLLDSELTMVSTFGNPDNTTANVWFTASSFLAYANALQTVRVIRATGSAGFGAAAAATASNSTTITVTIISGGVGYGTTLPIVTLTGGTGTYTSAVPTLSGGAVTAVTVTGATGYTTGDTPVVTFTSLTGAHRNATATGAGVLIANEDQYLAEYSMGQDDLNGMWAAKYPSDLGNSLAVSIADVNSYATWPYKSNFDGAPNTSAFVLTSGGSDDELHAVVIDSEGLFTGTPGTILERFAFMSKSAFGVAEDGTSIYYPQVINRQSNYIWWLDHPTDTQLGIDGSVNWGGAANVDYQTMSTKLTLSTITGNFTVGETVQDAVGISYAPAGSGATATASASSSTVVTVTVSAGGTGYTVAPTVTLTGGTGSYTSATATVVGGVVTAVTVSGATGYTIGDTPTVAFTVPGSGANAVVTVNSIGVVTAVTPLAGGSGYTAAPVITITGPGTGAVVTATIASNNVVSYTVVDGGSGYTTISGTVISWATPLLEIAPTAGAFTATNKVTGTLSNAFGTVSTFSGGVITNDLSGGVDGNANVEDGDLINGYLYFQSAEDIDISLVLTADADSTVVEYVIDNIVEVRLDCVLFMSPPQTAVVNNAGNEATDIIAYRNNFNDSSYVVMDSGWKYMYDKYNDVYRWVPLNGDIAGLCVYTDDIRAPWWSPAGYNRGFIKNVVKLAWNPRQAFRDELYQNAINPVISQPGAGTLLFGDKTLLSKPSAFSRINVRRLFIVMEKAISTAAKYSLFEFNDVFTRAQFVSMVEPYLRQIQGQRGIFDYRVVCDTTNNTPTVIDSNSFIGDIYVKPAYSINFIQLNFVAVSTGVDFAEVVGTFD
jgi:phage tail sheath protein FI